MNESSRIVALAGTLCSPAIFDPLAELLRPVATLEAISWMTSPGPWNLPAIAGSIASLIEAAGTSPVLVVGHSTGGAIALQLALDWPQLVNALVLIDTGPNMLAHGDVDSIIAAMDGSWGSNLFESVLDRSFANPLAPDVREQFLRYASTVQRAAAIDILKSQRAIDFTSRLEELHVPIAVIHGVSDPTRTVAQAEVFASAIPGAGLSLLPAGHSPMFELPLETAEIVLSIIDSAQGKPLEVPA